jgi:hypothetical protein
LLCFVLLSAGKLGLLNIKLQRGEIFMLKAFMGSPSPTRIAVAVALVFGSVSAHAGVTVDSIVATGSYQLGSDAIVNLLSSGSPNVDVGAFPSSGLNSAGLHSYGSDSGNFGSRSSGFGVYNVNGMFRISETITNTSAIAQNATFNFFITPGFINNEIGSALTGSNQVSAGLNFDIKRNGSSIWGSSATLSSNAGGTTYTTTGDAGLYNGAGTYYSVAGASRSVDLGVINAGQSITLSYEMSSFANGVSVAGPDRLVPEVTYHVPGQWVEPCGECGYGGQVAQYVEPYDVTVPAHTVLGTASGSHASSGDPFGIDWNGQAYFTGQPSADPFGNSVTFTAAVPEPSEYALMLAGLGLMGWTARRRRAGTSS